MTDNIIEITPHPTDRVPVHLLPHGECGFAIEGKGRTKYQEYAGDDVMHANIKSALERKLSEFQPSIVTHDGHAIIVGAGPSVSQFTDSIRSHKEAGRPVVAVKGAHDWLRGQGITPDIAVSMDSQARSLKFFKDKSPETCYLLASKVHPDVFDHLTDCQVVVWHAWFGDDTDKLYPPAATMVGGGSTSGLRAITLAWLMGFRKVSLYGFDSCLTGKQMRVDGSEAQQWMIPLQAGPNAPLRMCDAALASQAIEFQEMTFGILAGMKINVMGDGLIADIMKERVRLGNNDSF